MKKAKVLCLLTIVFPALVHAASFAFVQKDSPLQVVGATNDLDLKDFYSSIIAVNVSTKTILRAQFGWTMTDHDNKRMLGVGYGPLVDLNLSPLEVAKVGPQGATFSLVTETAKGVMHVGLILGVVYVKFQDGSEWKYPMEQRRGFDQIDDPALIQKIAPKVNEFREKNGLVGATRACPPRPDALQHKGVLSWLANMFSIQTVHAQGYPWFFVCNPSPSRACMNMVNACTTYVCMGTCSSYECCLLNGINGQLICE